MFTSSPRQAGLLGDSISNQARTSSLDSRHKVSYVQTEPGECPLSLQHHPAQLFASAGSALPMLLLRGCSSRSAVAIQLPLLQALISNCNGKGPGPSCTDGQALSRAPGPCPILPSRFTARFCAQPAHFSFKTKRKLCQKWSVLPALLLPAVVQGRQAIPISAAEGLQSSAAQTTSGSRADS